MQRDRLRVVIDRHIGTTPERPLDAQRGAAAAREQVDDQLVAEIERRLLHHDASRSGSRSSVRSNSDGIETALAAAWQ